MRIFKPCLFFVSIAIGTLMLSGISSCKTDFEDINYYDGNADFSKVVVVGGSHLAGYSDKALYLEAQSNSIPAILSNRLAFIGAYECLQPLVDPGVGIGILGNAKNVLQYVDDPCQSGKILIAAPIFSTGDINNYNWLGNDIAYNNLAVPNTRVSDLTRQSYGDPSPFLGNPFYARFATQPGTSTISGDALQQIPSFILVWIGMEDVYNYARKGGKLSGDSISNTSSFNNKFTNLINELTSLNAGGALLNIPEPSTIPFFNEIPFDGLVLTAAQADSLNILYASVDSTIVFHAGNNPFVIADPTIPTGRRQIKSGEFILQSVSRDSINCQGWGKTIPIPARYVLDEDEVADVMAAINAFNSTITSSAAAHNLALVDINTLFKTLNSSVMFNNVNYSTQYLHGGAFSTDGYHPSQRGSALITNEIVSTINRFYSAKIPLADVNAYPGIIFP